MEELDIGESEASNKWLIPNWNGQSPKIMQIPPNAWQCSKSSGCVTNDQKGYTITKNNGERRQMDVVLDPKMWSNTLRCGSIP